MTQKQTGNSNLEIIFDHEALIAINKPHGLLVHRSAYAQDVQEFALQRLRDQVGYRVYPVHRLDRKTSGVLLFAKDSGTNAYMQGLFQQRKVHKTYIAWVRGFVPEQGEINYPLEVEGKFQEAITHYQLIRHIEIALPFGRHATSRYSLVRLQPLTGRFHQLRKHMAHTRHPIIGDRPHGCNKQNKLWKEQFGLTTMLLHAQKLSFPWRNEENINIEADFQPEFKQVLAQFPGQG